MRKALWPSLLLLPTLAAAQATTDHVAPPAARLMVLENTATVHFDESVANLQERLHITASQQAEWIGFARSIDAYSRLFFAEQPQSATPGETAAAQLERMNHRMTLRMAGLRQIEVRGKALYAVLSPSQQQDADRYLLASVPVFGFLPPPPTR